MKIFFWGASANTSLQIVFLEMINNVHNGEVRDSPVSRTESTRASSRGVCVINCNCSLNPSVFRRIRRDQIDKGSRGITPFEAGSPPALIQSNFLYNQSFLTSKHYKLFRDNHFHMLHIKLCNQNWIQPSTRRKPVSTFILGFILCIKSAEPVAYTSMIKLFIFRIIYGIKCLNLGI